MDTEGEGNMREKEIKNIHTRDEGGKGKERKRHLRERE